MGLYALAELLELFKSDVEALDQMVLAINYESFKLEVADELNEMYRVASEEFMATRFPHIDTYTMMALKKMSIRIMGKMTQEATGVLVKKGPDEAITALQRFRKERMTDIMLSDIEECIHYGLSLNQNMITVLKTLSKIVESPEDSSESDYHFRWREIDVDRCAEEISSFANPHRINIMKMLNTRDCYFKELSSATGLKTGHLQFHLQDLMDKGFVEKIDKGLYCITKKGSNALNSIADFDRHMKLYKVIEETYGLE